MFWMSRSQNGRSRVMPSEPLVRLRQLVAMICADSSSAMVMMTNACPRVRSTTRPMRVASTTATTPPSGATQSGLTPVCSARTAAVYEPMPRNAECPSDT